MTTYKLKGILNNDAWICPAYIQVDEVGKIISIDSTADRIDHDLNVYGIPGFQNAHSHAFQYAMAGITETHSVSKTPDDFWSWREAMYGLALSISPEELEDIATMLYAEMLRHGYTNVAEFHYVHHAKNGQHYDNLSEMGERLVAAAKTAGIGITLIPIFYQKGGFGKAPTAGQIRFLSPDKAAYYELLAASQKSTQLYEYATLGIGIHSMRGVDSEIIAEVAKSGPQHLPFHIHVSEQLKEIEDSLAYLKQRPVEWLLNSIELTERFHLVHATHLVKAEILGIAASKANVVLCPSTEGNLGDGIFPLKEFQEIGGKWSIGTDSHVGLNPFEEIRLLDYGQRLISHKRNTYYFENNGDSGRNAIDMALMAGRLAMNNSATDYFKVGDYFNAVLMDADAPLIASTGRDYLASTFVYATDVSMQYGTISHGKLCVKEGKHVDNELIRTRFVATLKKLKTRL